MNTFEIWEQEIPHPKIKVTTPMGDPAKIYRHYAGVRSEGWDLSNYALQLTQKAFAEGFRYEGSMRILDRMPLREIIRYRWNRFYSTVRAAVRGTIFVWWVRTGLSRKWEVSRTIVIGSGFAKSTYSTYKGGHVIIVSKGKSK